MHPAKLAALATVLVMALVLLGVVLANADAFNSPTECVAAYREAVLAGDADGYLQCFADPLRGELLGRHADCVALSTALRQQHEGVKNWVEAVRWETPKFAVIQIRETRVTGETESTMDLAATESGWKIVRLRTAEQTSLRIPYGTHISKTP